MIHKHNKLVRDRIPEIIRKSNKSPITTTLDETEFEKELRMKLLEEANEAFQAKTTETLCDEVADLYEVIDALLEINQIDKSVVISKQSKKRVERGGFSTRTFLVEVDDHE